MKRLREEQQRFLANSERLSLLTYAIECRSTKFKLARELRRNFLLVVTVLAQDVSDLTESNLAVRMKLNGWSSLERFAPASRGLARKCQFRLIQKFVRLECRAKTNKWGAGDNRKDL
jgi:hypothetical protein